MLKYYKKDTFSFSWVFIIIQGLITQSWNKAVSIYHCFPTKASRHTATLKTGIRAKSRISPDHLCGFKEMKEEDSQEKEAD